MAESDIPKNAINRHHGKHHRTHAPKAQPHDGPSKGRHSKPADKGIGRKRDGRKEGKIS